MQDTSYIDLPDSVAKFQIIWDNVMGQIEIDSISAQFDGAEVDVFGTVTSLFGSVPETVNNNEIIWVIFADIRDYYPVLGVPVFVRLQSLNYAWPDDFDGNESTGNNVNCFYVNIGAYKNVQGEPWQRIRGSLHTWSVATGLGQFLRIANNRFEDRWIVRGLGVFAQYMCYGLTSEFNSRLGIRAYIRDFSRGGGIELSSWCSGQTGRDFGINQGGEFLWFKYIEQRLGSEVISKIVTSSNVGMLGIANSINPSVPDSISEEILIYPLYEHWLITNLVSHVAGDYADGIYRYSFLDDTDYSFTMIDSPASFIGEFSTYPIGTWIAHPYYGVSAQVFAAQYADFKGDYSLTGDTTVYFNGMFNQNTGSGSNLNGRWTVYKIVLTDDSTLFSVDSLELDEFYNGSFSLEGFRTCLVLTNNNPGGTARIRFVLSQDFAPKSLFLAALQNGVNQNYLQVYSSLLIDENEIPYGFDWTGPELKLSKMNASGFADSTAIIPMNPHPGSLWSGQARAWTEGSYNLVCSGFDSLGVSHQDSILFAVGYGGAGKLTLDIKTARLEIDDGLLSQGSMASIIESNHFGISVYSDIPLTSTGTLLTGVKAGPVIVSFNRGLISFPAENAEAAIFWFDGELWLEQNSYFLNERMYANVTEEGIYILGKGPGLLSPEISSVPVFQGSSPNPFSTTVTFRFSIPETGNVSLVVFDMYGRIVNTLACQQMAAGLHTVSWSGSDDSGISVPSGIYFARFTALDYSETVKLVRVGGV